METKLKTRTIAEHVGIETYESWPAKARIAIEDLEMQNRYLREDYAELLKGIKNLYNLSVSVDDNGKT